jgi:hypothetical protein
MLNMLEYARIFAYRTDMNLIERDERTNGRDGWTDAQTTLSSTSSGRKIKSNKIKILLFWLLLPAGKEGKKYFAFRFSIPKIPEFPEFPELVRFACEAARRRRFFRPSSPSHPSKLYSSLGWLNSKVPKPFPPFSSRLIDVDGF